MRVFSLPGLGVGLLLLTIAVLTLYPLGMLVYGSLHTTPPGEPGELSLEGYRAIATSRNAAVLANTVGISLVKTSLSMVLALGLAWIVARTDTPGRRTIEALVALPFFIPPVLTATAWGMLAAPRGGLINLGWAGLTGSSEPLVNIYSYGGVVWHMMQYTTPFLFLLSSSCSRPPFAPWTPLSKSRAGCRALPPGPRFAG
jgi:iron(III) transport system permease protein